MVHSVKENAHVIQRTPILSQIKILNKILQIFLREILSQTMLVRVLWKVLFKKKKQIASRFVCNRQFI